MTNLNLSNELTISYINFNCYNYNKYLYQIKILKGVAIKWEILAIHQEQIKSFL